MNFRGKRWARDGNQYRLIGTPIVVTVQGGGADRIYMIQAFGRERLPKWSQVVFDKNEAVKTALELAKRYKK